MLDAVTIADDTPHHISPSVATQQSSSTSTTPYQLLPAGANSIQVTPGAISNLVTSTGSKSNQIGDRSSETSMVVPKYLVSPSDTPSMKRSLQRARLMTSASVLAALEEKESNKRQAIEDTEKRNIEREQKKQREEQLKLKVKRQEKLQRKPRRKLKRRLSVSMPNMPNRTKQVLPNQQVQNESSHHHHPKRRVKCHKRKPESDNVPLRP